MQIDKLIRSKRKTVALILEADGRLVVRAPQRLALWRIQAVVDQKQAWIVMKRAELQRSAPDAKTDRAFAAGEEFWFRGVRYPLEILPRAAAPLRLTDRFELSAAALPRAKETFDAWYQTQARRIFPGRLQFFAEKMGVSYERLRLSSARTRWGSCSSRGTISLHWRLALAPPEILDYVVVHELAHRREPNHSPRFWAFVESVLPDFKIRRAWLKTHGRELT
jgi:hypothetical protein